MEPVYIKAIQLDLKNPKLTTIGDFTQNDTNIIKFTLVEDGNVINLNNLDQILINYQKPDGEVVSRIVTAENNVITYKLGFSEMEKPGLGKLVIQLFKSDNRISTFTVNVNVKKSIEANFSFEEVESGLVDQVIQEINLVKNRIDDLAFEGVDTSKIATKLELNELISQLRILQSEVEGLKNGNPGNPLPPDITSPSNVTNLTISNNTTGTSLTLTWAASTSNDVVGYEIYMGSTLLTTITGTSYNATGLTANASYTFTVKAKDTSNNVSSGTSVTATATLADTTAPILTITPATTFVNTLTVTMSTNETATIYYTLNGATPTETSPVYSTALTLNTTTTIKAFAKDIVGNTSAIQTISYTKTAVPDTTPPTNVTNLTASNISTNSVNLSWAASVSADVAGYDIYNGNTLITSITGTTYTVTGLSPNTSYTFVIKAKDGNNNVASGTNLNVTTVNTSITGISLNRNTANVQVNESLTLIATIEPISAPAQSVIWSSSDESVATVDNGLVSIVGVGNAIITATTIDGNHTASCNIYATAQIVGFDYNNLMTNTESVTPVTFDQTVSFSNYAYSDFVHPSVLYFEDGWNGHKYWMGITPYPATQGAYENPFFFYSDDGENWLTPQGLTQPIYPKETDVGNNSDSHLFMDYDGVTMHYLNRGAFASPKTGSMTEIFSTTDGVNWTQRQRILTTDNGDADYVSPSVCLVNGKYYMFATDVTDLVHIAILEAEDVNGTWTEIHRISTGDMGSLWHTEVRYINQEFIVVGNTGHYTGGNLMLGKFYSLTDEVVETRVNAFAVPPSVKGKIDVNGKETIWNDAIYKSSLVVKNQNDIELFIGFKGVGLAGNGTPWRVSRVHCTQLDQTLDLSEYIEVASYNDNSNNTSYNRIGDYNRYALDFTLALKADFKIGSFARTTNQAAYFYMEAGILKFQLWGVTINNVSTSVTHNVTYGIKVGDRITLVKDEDSVKLYINGRIADEFSIGSETFTWFGGAFGDYNSKISMTNIKQYVTQETLRSSGKADAYKTQLVTEYQQNPSNFILVDEFNRTELGTVSDNGAAYTIVGTPIIETNQLKPNDNGKVLISHEGDFSLFIKLGAPSAFFRVIYDYIDESNYKIFSPTSNGGSRSEYHTSIVAGGTNDNVKREIAIGKFAATFTYFRLDVIGNKVTVYGDGGYLFEYTITRATSPTKIGLNSFYAGTKFDYVYVKKIN